MEECRTIGSAAEPSSLGEGHLFVSPTESAEAPDHASYWKRRVCPHPQGGSGLTVGKGPHRLPTAHFPPFPSTLSSMEGGSPSSWPRLPPHAQPPRLSRGCQDGAHKALHHGCHNAPPTVPTLGGSGRAPTRPHPRTLPLCTKDSLSIVSNGQSLPVLCIVLEGPCQLPALNLASPLAPRVGLSSLPPTMPLGLQGTPPPTTCLQNLLPRSAESTSLPRLVGHL